jgi:hypothetical protein
MNVSQPVPGSPYFQKIEEILSTATARAELYKAIVNAPFHDLRQTTHLDLGIIVLLLANKGKGTIDRIALSDTEPAQGAVKMSEKPFNDIKIPLGHESNIIAQAIATGEPQNTHDWQLLFVPALSKEAARYNQAGAGIECSYVYPLKGKNGGALIFSLFQPGSLIDDSHRAFMQSYAELVGSFLNRAA